MISSQSEAVSGMKITVGHWPKTAHKARLVTHLHHDQDSRRGKFAGVHVQFHSAETPKAKPIEKSHPVVCSPWHGSTIKARTVSAVIFLLPTQ